MDADAWAAIAAWAGAAVTLGGGLYTGLYTRSQARSAREALRFARDSAGAAKDQAWSARESAKAARLSACAAVDQASSTREQTTIMREQLAADRETADEHDGPTFTLVGGHQQDGTEVQPDDNPSGEALVRVDVRPVRIERTGGPDEITVVIEIASVDPPWVPLRLNGGATLAQRMVQRAATDIEIVIPTSWPQPNMTVDLTLTATEVGGQQRTWDRRQAVQFQGPDRNWEF